MKGYQDSISHFPDNKVAEAIMLHNKSKCVCECSPLRHVSGGRPSQSVSLLNSLLESLRALVTTNESLKQQEQEFRTHCKVSTSHTHCRVSTSHTL